MSIKRTVLIAIDDSDSSEYAFDFYARHVHLADDKLILVHVPEYNNVLSTSSMLTDPNIINELLKETDEKTCELVEKYSLKMKESHLSGHVKQYSGKPGEAIIEASKEEEATFIILGTRGRGKVRRTFLGSVSDYCVHHSYCPVLVCKKQNEN